jgi:hypothetical protein
MDDVQTGNAGVLFFSYNIHLGLDAYRRFDAWETTKTEDKALMFGGVVAAAWITGSTIVFLFLMN